MPNRPHGDPLQDEPQEDGERAKDAGAEQGTPENTSEAQAEQSAGFLSSLWKKIADAPRRLIESLSRQEGVDAGAMNREQEEFANAGTDFEAEAEETIDAVKKGTISPEEAEALAKEQEERFKARLKTIWTKLNEPIILDKFGHERKKTIAYLSERYTEEEVHFRSVFEHIANDTDNGAYRALYAIYENTITNLGVALRIEQQVLRNVSHFNKYAQDELQWSKDRFEAQISGYKKDYKRKLHAEKDAQARRRADQRNRQKQAESHAKQGQRTPEQHAGDLLSKIHDGLSRISTARSLLKERLDAIDGELRGTDWGQRVARLRQEAQVELQIAEDLLQKSEKRLKEVGESKNRSRIQEENARCDVLIENARHRLRVMKNKAQAMVEEYNSLAVKPKMKAPEPAAPSAEPKGEPKAESRTQQNPDARAQSGKTADTAKDATPRGEPANPRTPLDDTEQEKEQKPPAAEPVESSNLPKNAYVPPVRPIHAAGATFLTPELEAMQQTELELQKKELRYVLVPEAKERFNRVLDAFEDLSDAQKKSLESLSFETMRMNVKADIRQNMFAYLEGFEATIPQALSALRLNIDYLKNIESAIAKAKLLPPEDDTSTVPPADESGAAPIPASFTGTDTSGTGSGDRPLPASGAAPDRKPPFDEATIADVVSALDEPRAKSTDAVAGKRHHVVKGELARRMKRSESGREKRVQELETALEAALASNRQLASELQTADETRSTELIENLERRIKNWEETARNLLEDAAEEENQRREAETRLAEKEHELSELNARLVAIEMQLAKQAAAVAAQAPSEPTFSIPIDAGSSAEKTADPAARTEAPEAQVSMPPEAQARIRPDQPFAEKKAALSLAFEKLKEDFDTEFHVLPDEQKKAKAIADFKKIYDAKIQELSAKIEGAKTEAGLRNAFEALGVDGEKLNTQFEAALKAGAEEAEKTQELAKLRKEAEKDYTSATEDILQVRDILDLQESDGELKFSYARRSVAIKDASIKKELRSATLGLALDALYAQLNKRNELMEKGDKGDVASYGEVSRIAHEASRVARQLESEARSIDQDEVDSLLVEYDAAKSVLDSMDVRLLAGMQQLEKEGLLDSHKEKVTLFDTKIGELESRLENGEIKNTKALAWELSERLSAFLEAVGAGPSFNFESVDVFDRKAVPDTELSSLVQSLKGRLEDKEEELKATLTQEFFASDLENLFKTAAQELKNAEQNSKKGENLDIARTAINTHLDTFAQIEKETERLFRQLAAEKEFGVYEPKIGKTYRPHIVTEGDEETGDARESRARHSIKERWNTFWDEKKLAKESESIIATENLLANLSGEYVEAHQKAESKRAAVAECRRKMESETDSRKMARNAARLSELSRELDATEKQERDLYRELNDVYRNYAKVYERRQKIANDAADRIKGLTGSFEARFGAASQTHEQLQTQLSDLQAKHANVESQMELLQFELEKAKLKDDIDAEFELDDRLNDLTALRDDMAHDIQEREHEIANLGKGIDALEPHVIRWRDARNNFTAMTKSSEFNLKELLEGHVPPTPGRNYVPVPKPTWQMPKGEAAKGATASAGARSEKGKTTGREAGNRGGGADTRKAEPSATKAESTDDKAESSRRYSLAQIQNAFENSGVTGLSGADLTSVLEEVKERNKKLFEEGGMIKNEKNTQSFTLALNRVLERQGHPRITPAEGRRTLTTYLY